MSPVTPSHDNTYRHTDTHTYTQTYTHTYTNTIIFTTTHTNIHTHVPTSYSTQSSRRSFLFRFFRDSSLCHGLQLMVGVEQDVHYLQENMMQNIPRRSIDPSCSHFLGGATIVTALIYLTVSQNNRNTTIRRFRIDTKDRCVGAHPPFWPLEPERVKPN